MDGYSVLNGNVLYLYNVLTCIFSIILLLFAVVVTVIPQHGVGRRKTASRYEPHRKQQHF